MVQYIDHDGTPLTKEQYDHRMLEADRQISVGLAHLSVVTGFANTAINSIILCNTAAAGAVLAFIGAIWANAAFKPAVQTAASTVWLFAIGATAGMCCAAASYLSQAGFQRYELLPKGAPKERFWQVWAEGFRLVAVVLAIVGIAVFPIGAWRGLGALAQAVAATP